MPGSSHILEWEILLFSWCQRIQLWNCVSKTKFPQKTLKSMQPYWWKTCVVNKDLFINVFFMHLPGNCGFSRLAATRQDQVTSASVTFMVSRLQDCEACHCRWLYTVALPKGWGRLSAAARLASWGERKIIHTVIKLVSSRHTLANWFNIYLQLPAWDLQLR